LQSASSTVIGCCAWATYEQKSIARFEHRDPNPQTSGHRHAPSCRPAIVKEKTMETLQQAINAKGIGMVSARIIDIGRNGRLLVKCDGDGVRISCVFVRTSAVLPSLRFGDAVLCLIDGDRGYVLGRMEPYRQELQAPEQLGLTANHDIELTCGQSSLSLQKNGRITLRGTRITTKKRIKSREPRCVSTREFPRPDIASSDRGQRCALVTTS
jgi:hypothetical protein